MHHIGRMIAPKKISDFLIPVIALLFLLLIGYTYVQNIHERVPANYPPNPPENLTANYKANCEDALDLVAPCILFVWNPNSTGNLTDGYNGTMNNEGIAVYANNYREFTPIPHASYNISIRAVNKSGVISYSSYVTRNYTMGK
jgi:hypothetical protein